MNKIKVNPALQLFSTFENWDAFIDLVETRPDIQKVWIETLRRKIKDEFRSDEVWEMEFGGWWDVRWHFISSSAIKMNFWLSVDGSFHFVVHNDGTKAELIKRAFNQLKFYPLKYVWGTDILTNFNYEIKIKQVGKWYFNSDYDGNFTEERLIWFAGNEPQKFVDQIIEKVEKFKSPQIVDLLKELQSDIEIALSTIN